MGWFSTTQEACETCKNKDLLSEKVCTERAICKHEKWLPSLSFSGCGLHVFFQLGAAHCLLDNNVRCNRICATSAGVASALYYLLDMRPYLNLEQLLKMIPCEDVDKDSSLYGNKKNGVRLARRRMIKYLGNIINKHYPNAYKHISKHLEVVLMEFPSCRIKHVNKWKDNEDLIRCLCACTDIPSINTKINPTRWRGCTYYDGGILCSHPIIDSNTVCITTSSFSQPWSRAWRFKDGWYGDICHPISCGSLKIMDRCFYRELWHIGCKNSQKYITDNFFCQTN